VEENLWANPRNGTVIQDVSKFQHRRGSCGQDPLGHSHKGTADLSLSQLKAVIGDAPWTS
jgi:hypothetical protein